MMERSDEEWKEVTEGIFKKPDFEKVKIEMQGLLSGKRNRDSKLAMHNIAKYYFFDERTKARARGGHAFHEILESKQAYNEATERTYRYFSKHLYDGPDLRKRLIKWVHDMARMFQAWGIPTQFPFRTAFPIYQKYNFNGKVFDYSCGWGNRLVAALCNRLDYTGVDTNLELVKKLLKCASDFNMVNNLDLKVDIRNQGSEIFNPEWMEQFGLCFSSPPYFDLELYNGEQTSTEKFKTYEDWIEGYLRPTIVNCSKYLVPGGNFIMSIKNMGKRKMYDSAFKMCEEAGLSFMREEELQVIRRTGANNTKHQGLSASNEKLMVFRKTVQEA